MDEQTNLLRRIAAQTAPTVEHSFVVTSPAGSSTDAFDVGFPTPIRAREGRVLEMALRGLRTSYSWANVTRSNNTFVYSTNGGTAWKPITLPVGAYEVEAINSAVQTAMKQAGDWGQDKQAHYIKITPNLATLRTVIEITNDNYRVDISSSTLRSILGWPTGVAVLAQGRHEAPNIVAITSVNEVVVHCDAVDGTYTKPASSGEANQGYVLGSFFPDVPPGYKVIHSPRYLNWLRVFKPELSRLRFWITDQDDRPIDLRGEPLTINCLVRDVANVL